MGVILRQEIMMTAREMHRVTEAVTAVGTKPPRQVETRVRRQTVALDVARVE